MDQTPPMTHAPSFTQEFASTDGLRTKQWYQNPTVQVLIAVFVGGGLGLGFAALGWSSSGFEKILALPGQLWLKALKCIVLPFIVLAMVEAAIMLRALPGAKKVAVSVVLLYLFTTVVAVVEGCIAATLIIGPFVDELETPAPPGGSVTTTTPLPIQQKTLSETILGIITNMVPTNLVNDPMRNNLLPVIMASLVFGMFVKDKNADGSTTKIVECLYDVKEVVVVVITGIMSVTFLGVGSLVFGSASRLDLAEVGGDMAFLVLGVSAGLLVHMFVFYPVLLVLLAQRSPLTYYNNILPALMTALGTASSAATLPVSIKHAVQDNEIAPKIADFVLGIGATINMDGTSIYLVCATFFLGSLQGVSFTIGDLITICLLATLCSAGSAPVPSASLVLLATITSAVGINLNQYHFALIVTVDWLLDRLRTTVNVAGDATVTAIVQRYFGTSMTTIEMSGELLSK